jgi:transcription elongation factor GreA
MAALLMALPTSRARTTFMATRQALPPVLRGDEAADLGPAARERLESIAHEAHSEGMLVFVKDECAARLRQPAPPNAVSYLLAAVLALRGEMEAAHQTLLRLGERLAEKSLWEPLAAVADRALGLETTQAAAKLLVKAHEGLGRDPARIEALEQAVEVLPDDLELALLLAVRLGEAGQGERRRSLLATLLPRFAAEGRWAGLEEAALEFSEHLDADGLIELAEALPAVADKGALAEASALLSIAFPPLDKEARTGELETPLRAVVAKALAAGGEAAAAPFRDALVSAIRHGRGRALPGADMVFATAGLADRMKPLGPALERFDRIAAIPPGQAVIHASFGPGRISGNDGDVVLVDFSGRPGHRMPYDAARRTLSPISEEDLRLMGATDPAKLERLRNEEPAEILTRALMSLGGEADAKKLKLFLVGSNLVPAAEWTAFWRRARAAAEKDPRIDHARAFEQHYRLQPGADDGAGEGDAPADAPLPPLQVRKLAKSNLATIRRFLTQHPQAEQALARRFGRYVESVMRDGEAERADRARAGLHFARWSPERKHEWTSMLKGLWDEGLVVSDLPAEDEQLALLASAHEAGVEADAILSGLNSRFSAVRDAAAEIRERLDEAGRRALHLTLLDHAPRYPSAALRAIEEDLAGPGPAEPWRTFLAALKLIEETPKGSVANKVLAWLEPGGPFEPVLAAGPCPEDMQLRIRVLLRQWRSSDRYLLPALDAVSRLGHRDTVETVQRARRASAEKLFEGVGRQAEEHDVPVMTRATWDRLQKELERLQHELRNVIPKTIQKARELGDLKENAEYHSAKQKQANVSKLVASLQLRLTRARFVEEAEHRDGTVGLGTEVVLEDEDQNVTTYWILGEDEHHHGEHVVSFHAPVGRALMGHAIGEEVELPEGERRKRFRIVSVERRIPASESESRG